MKLLSVNFPLDDPGLVVSSARLGVRRRICSFGVEGAVAMSLGDGGDPQYSVGFAEVELSGMVRRASR